MVMDETYELPYFVWMKIRLLVWCSPECQALLVNENGDIWSNLVNHPWIFGFTSPNR